MSQSRSFLFAMALLCAIVLSRHGAVSSRPPCQPHVAYPSSSPSLLPSASADGVSADTSLSKITSHDNGENPGRNTDENNRNNPPRPLRSTASLSSSFSSASVTFLYELYEHEIYDPKTDGWTSRRFTQSPMTGGGGRDSTSLDPQFCTPPRHYSFDGEWKIDMARSGGGGRGSGYSRDGFGWEYYVGRYDGLGRRRRRWVRSLRRVGGPGGAAIIAKKFTDAGEGERLSTESAHKYVERTTVWRSNPLHAIRDQYNFKGFGWSFYKSFIFRQSLGAAFRVPLSANFDSYDGPAVPYISSSTYFGYPWVVATFLNASLPLEAIRWMVGGIVWKLQWGLAVLSSLIRSFTEATVWIVLWPWRVWNVCDHTAGVIANIIHLKRQEEEKMVKLLADKVEKVVNEDETASIVGGADVTIETLIEINNTSEYEGNGETSLIKNSTTAVVIDSPRGGSASSRTAARTQSASQKRKHLTMFGNEIPSFHRKTSVEYSSTIQERIGICMSWRVSKEWGYEYRWHFFYTCLPTLIFWGQLDEERKRCVKMARRRFVGGGTRGHKKGKNNAPLPSSSVTAYRVDQEKVAESKSSSNSSQLLKSPLKSAPILSTFLNKHSSTMGISAGWPLPMEPFFSLNLMLSLSGFYYGWLLRYIRSLFVLPTPNSPRSKGRSRAFIENNYAAISPTTANGHYNSVGARNEKVVSSALKKKLLMDDVDGLRAAIDDEGTSITAAQLDHFGSD